MRGLGIPASVIDIETNRNSSLDGGNAKNARDKKQCWAIPQPLNDWALHASMLANHPLYYFVVGRLRSDFRDWNLMSVIG